MRQYQVVLRAFHRISNFFTWIATGALFAMMLLTAADVAGRYLFKHPILGAQDLVEQFMVVLVFCVLGQVTIDRTHIRADLLNARLSRRGQAIANAYGFVIVFVTAVIMAWRASIEAAGYVTNLRLVTATIKVPVAPFYVFAALGLILLSFEALFDTISYIVEAKEAPQTEREELEEVNELGVVGEGAANGT